jgi:hypothetical protein
MAQTLSLEVSATWSRLCCLEGLKRCLTQQRSTFSLPMRHPTPGCTGLLRRVGVTMCLAALACAEAGAAVTLVASGAPGEPAALRVDRGREAGDLAVIVSLTGAVNPPGTVTLAVVRLPDGTASQAVVSLPRPPTATAIAGPVQATIQGTSSLTASYVLETVELFAADSLSTGWRYLSWFGAYYSPKTPWFYHETLGWVYSTGGLMGTDYVYYYDPAPGMGWMATRSDLFPWLYRYSASDWIYYGGGSAPRWFYLTGVGWVSR